MSVKPVCRGIIAVAVTLAVVVVAVPASTAAEPVDLNLQLPDKATVSGTTNFSFTVSDEIGVGLTSATVTLSGQTGTVALEPHACEPICTQSVALDTVPVPDGLRTVRVSASDATGEVAHEDFVVKVGNDPLVSFAPSDGGQLFTARSTLSVHAYPVARGGATISGVRWVDGPRSTTFAPATEPNGPWTTTTDTSALPEGTYSGSVVATDSRGRTVTSRPLEYGVVRSMTLTGPTLTGTVDDYRLGELSVDFAHAAGVRDAFPELVTTTLDGVEISRHVRPLPLQIDEANANGRVSVDTGPRISPGAHHLTISLLDSRGLTRSLDYHFTVRQTLAARWTGGDGATVVDGSQLEVTAQVDVAGVDIDCMVSIDGRPQGPPVGCTPSGDGRRDLRATLPIGYDGRREHPVVLTIAPDHGPPVVLRTTIIVLPRLVGLLEATGGGLPGAPVVLNGRVGGSAGQPVEVLLQSRTRGAKGWHRVAGTTTRPDGSLSFTVTPTNTADYRLVTHARTGWWGGAVGPARTVRIAATLRVTKKPTTVARGAAFVVEGSTRPAAGRPTVTLQVFYPSADGWVEAGRTRSDLEGHVAFSRRQYAPTQRYRLVRETSADAYGSVSGEFVVTLK